MTLSQEDDPNSHWYISPSEKAALQAESDKLAGESTVQTAPQAQPLQPAPPQAPQGEQTISTAPPAGQETGIQPPGETPSYLNQQAFESGYMGKDIAPTRWQDLGNRAALAWKTGLGGEAVDSIRQNGFSDFTPFQGLPPTKISPEEAQRRFPGMPEPFTKPVDPAIAQMQYDRYNEIKLRQQWAMHGGDHPWEDFAVGAGVSIVDPWNVALMVTGEGLFNAAGVAKVGQAGYTALQNTIVAGAKNLALGGVIGASSYEFEKSQHTNPDFDEIAASTLKQVAGMSLLHLGLSSLFERAAELQRKTPPDLQAEAFRTAVVQHESDAAINVTPQQLEAQMRAKGELEGRASPYVFQPTAHPAEAAHYIPINGSEAPVKMGTGSSRMFQFDAVSDPNVANNLAGENGKVAEAKLPKEGKFLDADKPLPPELQKIAHDAILKDEAENGRKKIGQQMFTAEDLADMPAGEILHYLASTVQEAKERPAGEYAQTDELTKAMKEAGYLGLQSNVYGEGREPIHSEVSLFDKPEIGNIHVADPDLARSVPDDVKEQHIEESTSPEASKFWTDANREQLQESKHTEPVNSTPDYMDKPVQEQIDQGMKDLTKRAEAGDATAKAHLEELKADDAQHAQEKNALKTFTDCILGGIT